MTRMREEIGQTPSVVERVLRESGPGLGEAAAAIRAAAPRFAVVAARGTSDNAGRYGRYLLETHLGIPTGLAAASVLTTYHARLAWDGVLVLGLSQSGQSPDICAILEDARRGGATTIAITNDPASPLARAAAHVLECRAGEERAVAATKTYVAELAVIAGLVAALVPDSPMARALPGVPGALAAAEGAGAAWVREVETLDSPSAELAKATRAIVTSRGFNMATALEIALKLKETSRIFAEGYSTADLEHGPVALAQEAVPTLFFRPDGPMGASIDIVLRRARGSGAHPWIVGGPELLTVRAPEDQPPHVLDDGLPEPLTPLTYAIPGQLLAEATARRRGSDPDAPPGLSKVTLTR